MERPIIFLHGEILIMGGWRTKFILLLIVYLAVGGKQPIKMFHDGEIFTRQAVKKVVESNL